MKLIVITPSKDVDDETTLVTKMFESGLSTLHLRKPKHSTNQMAAYIREIPAHFHNRIIIHSHHDLAYKFDLKGIHLSKIHLSKKWKYWFVRLRLKMRFGKTSKSRSYSRLQQVYNTEEHDYNYYFLGTMFNNMTGELYSGFYEDGVIAANKNSKKNLIARGGTRPDTIQMAKKLGFYGIAFNSYLWDAESPYDNFLKILAEFKKINLEFE
ncbi:MAG: thiamine phosphate synthase [Bacteroidia bacterium]|nr:thiamine phosphate synthase [Bacteroidia bacterium]